MKLLQRTSAALLLALAVSLATGCATVGKSTDTAESVVDVAVAAKSDLFGAWRTVVRFFENVKNSVLGKVLPKAATETNTVKSASGVSFQYAIDAAPSPTRPAPLNRLNSQ